MHYTWHRQSLDEQYSKVTQAVRFLIDYQEEEKHDIISAVNTLKESEKKAREAYAHPKVPITKTCLLFNTRM